MPKNAIDRQYFQQCALMYHLFALRLYLDDRFDVRTITDERARAVWGGVDELLNYCYDEFIDGLERYTGGAVDDARYAAFDRFSDAFSVQIGDVFEQVLVEAVSRELRSLLTDYVLTQTIPAVSRFFQKHVASVRPADAARYAALFDPIAPLLGLETARLAAELVAVGYPLDDIGHVWVHVELLYDFKLSSAEAVDLFSS